MFKAVLVSNVISWIILIFILGTQNYPRSILILNLLFNILLTSLIRLSIRVYYSYYHMESIHENPALRKTLLLVGAGKTGEKIAREILTTARSEFRIAGFVDDDPNKEGAFIHGKKVLCKVSQIKNIQIDYDEVLITAPSASGTQIREIIDACKNTGKKYRIVPGFNELIDKNISLSKVRDLSYSDLLGRDEVKLDSISIGNILYSKRVLITGAGGSIGSELIKQCIKFEPSEIICLDQSEEKIFNLMEEAKSSNFKTVMKCVLATVNSKEELNKVFLENRPHIVFHAAAYKHVPIQEKHPWTAVKTNIIGTLNMVTLSDKYNVDKFVFVSTDKAVNPVNIMGATKRVSEKLIQSYNKVSKTCFMAVRFGNVLGSSGSAVPIFQKQIKKGGPLTITHPEMTRYFMSIQEASQLIIQCGALGNDGEIFLLKMGNPIRILNMAKDLIRLSGLEPENDIPIVFTGLRPGEKLYEELHHREEKKVATVHEKIMILQKNNSLEPWSIFNDRLLQLVDAAETCNDDLIRSVLKLIVPNYENNQFNIDKPFRVKAEA
ncbi:polysaccharide biosynthesis protein [bacterium]|nr:polysaccharide biosynthesis protein [bacterium]